MSYLVDKETFNLAQEGHLKTIKNSLLDYEQFLFSYGTMPSMGLVDTGLELVSKEVKQ